MKNKITKKVIASLMLSAFLSANSMSAVLAADDYGYGSPSPVIRGNESTPISLRSGLTISNGDSTVNLSLRDADVKQVLRMFADQAGMNIIFSPDMDATGSEGGAKGKVTLDMVDMPLSQAFDLVIETQKLYYDIRENTLVISSSGENQLSLAKRTSMTMIPVKYVNAAGMAHFINKNVFTKSTSTPGLSTKASVVTNPGLNELIVTGTEYDVALVRRIVEQFDKKPAITTFKVNHTTPAEMANAICSTLIPSAMGAVTSDGSSGGAAGIPTGFASDEGGGDSGGDGGSGMSVGGGKLACTPALQNFETSSGDDGEEALISYPSMNLSVSYFPAQGTIQIIGGSESQIDMIREYIALNDKKTPQAFLEVQIVSLSESGRKTLDNTWQFMSKNFSFNAGGGNSGTPAQHPVFFAGHGFGYIDDEVVDGHKIPVSIMQKWSLSPQLVYAVNYIIENRKGRVLANPKILITNGQASSIDLTSDYVSKVTSQYLDNGAASGSAQVQREYDISNDNGIKVEITPFISPDGYVTLDIKPEYKTIAEKIYAKGETGEEELQATLLQRRDLSLKGIRIKDGETLVIGGLIQESETKTVKKIPFLGDIPVVGMFFRSTGTEKAKEEMVIMITPQILVDNEDAVADDNVL